MTPSVGFARRGSAGRSSRVLHVRSTRGRHGPERALLELLPALAEQGVTVRLLALHRSRRAPHSPPPPALGWLEEARAAGAEVVAARDPAPASPAGIHAIRRAARDVDLIHSHDYRADLLTWAAGRSARLHAPWVATVHLHTRESARLRLWRRLDLRALRAATRVTTVSAAQVAELAGAGLDPTRIEHVPNAIDADRFAAAVGDVTGLAGRLRGGASGPLLVFVGRLTRQKGVDVLLAALPALRARWPGLVLAVAGDGAERPSLERQARALGVDAGLRWLGEVHDVPTLLAAADVVVLPSRREGHPMVLLEAMAVGAPVVASRAPGIVGAVSAGHAACLVPPEDAAVLADGIASLLADPAAAHALGAAAAVEVRVRYTPSVVAGRLAAIYRAALGEGAFDP